jgi:phosphohistidine phosphatase
MKRRIVLCRHAKSDWSGNTSDFDRPLKKRGLEDIAKTGTVLKAAGFHSDLIVSSPAVRAWSTAKGIAEWIGYEEKIRTEEGIYEATPGELFSIIQKLDDKVETAMLFGHNPGMEMLCAFLLSQSSPFRMPTLGMAMFEFFGSWKTLAPGQAVLGWFLVPSALRKKEGKEED